MLDHAACDAALAAKDAEIALLRGQVDEEHLLRFQYAAAAEERTEFWKQRAERTLVELKRVNAAAEEKVAALEANLQRKLGRLQIADDLLATTESKLSIAVAALERIKTYPFRQYDLSVTQGDIAREALERIEGE